MKYSYLAILLMLGLICLPTVSSAQTASNSTADVSTVSISNATAQVPQAVTPDEEKATRILTLEKCVQIGLRQNPTIVSARRQLLSSDSNVKSARGNFGASVDMSYGYRHQNKQPTLMGVNSDYQDKWSMGINISQPIFTGFNLLSNYQKAKIQREQDEARLYELSLIQEIQTSFLTLLQGRMDVKSKQDSVARLESQLKVIEAFYQVGLRPRVDVLQAEVELASAQQDLLKSQNDVSSRHARLNTLLNLPIDENINYSGELTYLPFSRSLDDCINTADRDRPDLRIAKKSIKVAEEDVDISESDYYPHVSADFDYNRAGGDPLTDTNRYTKNPESWSAGATVNWNVFSWGSTYYDVKRAKEQVKKIKADFENTRLEASYQIKDNLLSLKAAADRIGVGRKSVEAGREGYRMAMARYQAQVSTNNEVLNAQSRLSGSEAELIQALADYQVALARLYVAMGVKNPSLKTN
jgi:outer membrane protein TolC